MSEGERIIDLAGVPLGRDRHICAFFHTVEEEYRVLLPFINQFLLELRERDAHRASAA